MNKRKCQINAVTPVTCFQVPIIGNTELNLTTEEIYKCLCSKAEVTEVLSNGTTVTLDFGNYENPEVLIEDSITEQEPESFDNEKESEVLTEEPVTIEQEEPEVLTEEPVTIEQEEPEVLTEEPVTIEQDQSLVQSHEVHSRNNNYNGKNRKNKR